jgi:CRISPR/Cas system-associated exonuclease Cas4 (RecB family)
VQAAKHVFLPYMSEKGEEISRKAIAKRVKQMETLDMLTKDVETEIDVEVALDRGIVTGIIDVVQVNEDNTVHVRDWKSSIHDEFFARYERQMQFYAYALSQEGRTVSGADVVDIAKSAEEGKLIARRVEIKETETAGIIKALNEGLKGIGSKQFSARPSKTACTVCDVRRVCAVRVD